MWLTYLILLCTLQQFCVSHDRRDRPKMSDRVQNKCRPQVATINLFRAVRRIRLQPTAPLGGRNWHNSCQYYGDVIGDANLSVFGQFNSDNKFYGLLHDDRNDRLYAINEGNVSESSSGTHQNIKSVLHRLGYLSGDASKRNQSASILRRGRGMVKLGRLFANVTESSTASGVSVLNRSVVSQSSVTTDLLKIIVASQTSIPTFDMLDKTQANNHSLGIDQQNEMTVLNLSLKTEAPLNRLFGHRAAITTITGKPILMDSMTTSTPSGLRNIIWHVFECGLTLISDYTCMYEIGHGNLRITEALLTDLVRRINGIFRNVDFVIKGDTSRVKFHVDQVLVQRDTPNDPYPEIMVVNGSAVGRQALFDAMVHRWGGKANGSCYGIFFTCRDFPADDEGHESLRVKDDRQVSLKYNDEGLWIRKAVKRSNSVCGPSGTICQTGSGNLGLVNLKCAGDVMNRGLSTLTLARALGRAFGADYDNASSPCFLVNATSVGWSDPSAPRESYVMSTPFFDRPEYVQIRFSPCSVASMRAGVDKNGSCLKRHQASIIDYVYYDVSQVCRIGAEATVLHLLLTSAVAVSALF